MKDKKTFSDNTPSRYESDDYRVSYSRRSIIIIAAVSILLAFIIWMFAVASDSAVHNYTDIAIEIKNAETITDAGYEVLLGTETVSFRVSGRSSVINALTDHSVVPYVDLSGIELPADGSRIEVDVKFASEYNLMYSNISADSIYIQIIDRTE